MLIIREVCTGGEGQKGIAPWRSRAPVQRRFEILREDRSYVDCFLTLSRAREAAKRLGEPFVVIPNKLTAYKPSPAARKAAAE